MLWRRHVRATVTVLTLLTFGCAELRYPTSTPMVEVAPSAVAVGPPISLSRTGTTSWRALIVAGSAALIAGGALMLGGGLAYQEQQRADAIEAQQCAAQMREFLCGLDNITSGLGDVTIAYFGGVIGTAGLVLISIGLGVRFRRKRTAAK